ncbi:MAG: ATP-dependent DNA helicase [Planctomycetota bacterium]
MIRRLRRIVRTARARTRLARRGAVEARALCFPYAQARPHQEEMVAFVRTALEAGRPALVEAPTGIGKTVAALLAALRFARARGALMYFLTAKRTQRARVAETFCDLAAAAGREAGAPRALTLRPQSAMCPPGTLFCHPQHCDHLARLCDRARKKSALAALLAGPAHIEPQLVFELGRRERLCPHVLSLLLCARADLVIGDYNHVYRSASPPGQFPGEILPRPVVVVIDEAHNLFDRARAYESPFLPRRRVTLLREELQRSPGPVERRLVRLLDDVLASIDGAIGRSAAEGAAFPDGCRPWEGDATPWTAHAERGAHLLLPYVRQQHARGLTRPDDPLLDVLDCIGRLRDRIQADDPALVPYAAVSDDAPRGPGVGVHCVDPSARLAARHGDVLGTVAMSATLSPLPHYAKVLGFDALEPHAVAFGSPFPVEQRCVAVVPTVCTTWRARRRHYHHIARIVERVVAVRPGHYVAYFPSFAFLREVRALLALPPESLLVQIPHMTDEARAGVLERLVRDPAPLLLLAVAGGVFAEGIDLPGNALIGAIVVGPALPQVGLERAAMQHHFEESGGEGFARAMLYPGMQRVVQAAGRVHRTPNDRGVIVLLGRRLAQPPYVDCVPSHWTRYGIEEAIVEDPVPRLAAFWAEKPDSPPSCMPRHAARS